MKLAFMIVGWVVFVILIIAFIYGAHEDESDEETIEQDESNWAGRYKYTRKDNYEKDCN